MDKLSEQLTTIWDGPVQWQCPMGDFSTLGVGGKAEALVVPETISSLVILVRGLTQHGIPWQVIGRGSNILVAENGMSGVVIVMGPSIGRIRYGEMAEDDSMAARVVKPEEEDAVLVTVEAGCPVSSLLNWAISEGVSGLEFLAGIPGSFGGAIAMNAGAMGKEMAEIIVSVDMLAGDGLIYTKKTEKSHFQYRHWLGAPGDIILSGLLRLSRDDGRLIKKRYFDNIALRKKNQPKGASAGSFFKNPSGDFAGRLIESVGLKGFMVGGAQVSPIHANFIITNGNATASDVLSLMGQIQERVKKETGVRLEPEVKIFGI